MFVPYRKPPSASPARSASHGDEFSSFQGEALDISAAFTLELATFAGNLSSGGMPSDCWTCYTIAVTFAKGAHA